MLETPIHLKYVREALVSPWHLAPGMLTISKMAHTSPRSRVINEHESVISLMMSDRFRMHWNNNLGKAGKVLKMLKEARARSFA